jgi:S-adenosylmethionine:tRNA ribosyltransferase-isomerase
MIGSGLLVRHEAVPKKLPKRNDGITQVFFAIPSAFLYFITPPMKVDLFDFDLPKQYIADRPASPRDSARLLDLTGEAFVDRVVRDLPDCLQPGDLLIGNNTKVIPARLDGFRDAVRIEVTLHMRTGDDEWLAFAKPGKRLKVGQIVRFGDSFEAEMTEKRESGDVRLRFNCGGEELFRRLEEVGRMPLPPYIQRQRDDEENQDDKERYQTVFAKEEGAVAAPTAGLHFTPELFEKLKDRGVGFETVTLHVGAGTFLPVKVDDTEDHQMHSEWGTLSQSTVDKVNETRRSGGRIIAVGTTSLRLLESAAREPGVIEPFSGETDIFITPGYRFKVVDLLLTNFHLPRSTLFMLVSAFAGLERMHAAYEHAKQKNYRFYSYGDACLLKRAHD